MRRLRTLLKDRRAIDAVAKCADRSVGLSNEEFGLLCFEAGRDSTKGPANDAMVHSMLIGDPDAFGRLFKRELAASWRRR